MMGFSWCGVDALSLTAQCKDMYWTPSGFVELQLRYGSVMLRWVGFVLLVRLGRFVRQSD